jgi:hypothetical protein
MGAGEAAREASPRALNCILLDELGERGWLNELIEIDQ